MKLVVGLGNPGKKYENTRHNVGFMVIDEIVKKEELPQDNSKKFISEIAEQKTNEKHILYLKPQTFMNESGHAVRALVDFYKLTPQDIVIIHDEKDIPLGTYKIQTNRGAAGHNGVLSIIEHLGTANFTRIRIGIGPEKNIVEHIEKYVLEEFSTEERQKLKKTIEEIVVKLKELL